MAWYRELKQRVEIRVCFTICKGPGNALRTRTLLAGYDTYCCSLRSQSVPRRLVKSGISTIPAEPRCWVVSTI